MKVASKFISLLPAVFLATSGALAADMPARDLPTFAQPQIAAPTWFVHFGPAGIILDESAKISVMGGPAVPGASVKVKDQITVALEVGYFFTPNWAVSFTGGFPPTVDIMGRGTVAGLGKLGAITYGPTTLTAHYHFTNFGRFQPYIGAGPTFMVVLNNKNGALANLDVRNAIGFAAQVGFDYMLNDKWGIFVDVKKAYLRTVATGTLGGAPVRSEVKLDPWVVHTGVNYRF